MSEFLQKCPLFAQQSAGMLAEFAGRMKREQFGPDQEIIRQGEVGDRFYVIVSGTVDIMTRKNGAPATAATLGAGEFFGEVALLTGAPRNATVVSRNSVELLSLSKEDFDNALQRSKTLDERLREALYRRT